MTLFSAMTSRQRGLIMTLLATLLGVLLIGLVSGCSNLAYYAQSIHGHFSMLAAAKPIDEWLSQNDTPPKLAERLKLSQQIRDFAVRELALPDNRSYRRYADLKRPYVVWNVFAAPTLSLELKTWCFPITGCVSYRGYFHQEEANQLAATLRATGYDVQVVGIPAYSTLGYFDDPLLNTFIQYPAGELARMIFHELAHQVVFVKNNSTFNESFATAVEEAGVEHWLNQQADPALLSQYQVLDRRRQQFRRLLMDYRQRLAALYESPVGDAQKQSGKTQLLTQLGQDYQTLKTSWEGFAGYDRFFADGVNNAHLGAVATYTEQVPFFRALLAEQQAKPTAPSAVSAASTTATPLSPTAQQFAAFYQQVKQLATQADRLPQSGTTQPNTTIK